MTFWSTLLQLPPHARRVVDHGFDALVAQATRIPRRRAWVITVVAIIVTALADRATGSRLWFGPLYLLIICLPAWALGRRAAFLVGLSCAAVALVANDMKIYPHVELALVWDMAMRILSMTIIVMLVGGFRRSYDREWSRARNDDLTGALSKQAFYERAAMVSHRHGGILAYIDLDGFKKINDRHGHAAGDELLRDFAAGVRSSIRATDIFARIGGDEFLLFLPVEDEAEGYRFATELHARMNDILKRLSWPVRCSMGALVVSGGSSTIADADIELADRLMYQAKQQGGGVLRTAARGNLLSITSDDAADREILGDTPWDETSAPRRAVGW